MSESQLRRDVAAWVRKAEEDRGMALSANRYLYPGGVCFHCQQCIEKYLKAVLVAHDQVPERVHDLVVLGTECADHLPEIEDVFPDLQFLNPFSVAIRYPDRETDPEEALEAIEAMERARTPLRDALGLDPTDQNEEQADDGSCTGLDATRNDNTTTGASRADQS